MRPSVSIVIVNWNSGTQLRDCISSIGGTQRTGFLIDQVVVVDNASTDGSLDCVEVDRMPIRLMRNSENVGFAAACNQGAAECNGDYLLFLNPDTRLFNDSIVVPVEFMEMKENASIGICGVRLVDERGRMVASAARFPSLLIVAGKITGMSRLLPHIFPTHLLTAGEMRTSRLVDQIIGAFFLIRREVFNLCSGFDERFFVYFEEVDLSIRARSLGHSSFYLASASAFHRGGGCSDQVKSARLFYSLSSRALYFSKHMSRFEYLVLILLTVVELPIRLVRGIAARSLVDVRDTLAAYSRLITYSLRNGRRDS